MHFTIYTAHHTLALNSVYKKKGSCKQGSLQINRERRLDIYLLPRIDNTVAQLRHACFFLSIGLQSGYWLIEVGEWAREKTALIILNGLYKFKVMSSGL